MCVCVCMRACVLCACLLELNMAAKALFSIRSNTTQILICSYNGTHTHTAW